MTLQFCNPINIPLKRKCVAVDYRGGIEVDEVDEVDGRSPVERAAATFFLNSENYKFVTSGNSSSRTIRANEN